MSIPTARLNYDDVLTDHANRLIGQLWSADAELSRALNNARYNCHGQWASNGTLWQHLSVGELFPMPPGERPKLPRLQEMVTGMVKDFLEGLPKRLAIKAPGHLELLTRGLVEVVCDKAITPECDISVVRGLKADHWLLHMKFFGTFVAERPA